MGAKGARYSTFNSPRVYGSLATSNWLAYCCSCCYARRRSARGPSTSSDSNEPDEPVESSSIGTTGSRDRAELALDEVLPRKRGYAAVPGNGISVRKEDVEEASLIDNRDAGHPIADSPSNSRSKSSGGTLSGMRRMIGSLPAPLPRRERKRPSPSVDEKGASENGDSTETEIPGASSVFARCSKRQHGQRQRAMNIPELIISQSQGDSDDLGKSISRFLLLI